MTGRHETSTPVWIVNIQTTLLTELTGAELKLADVLLRVEDEALVEEDTADEDTAEEEVEVVDLELLVSVGDVEVVEGVLSVTVTA